MATKVFCDACGKEMDDNGHVSVEVYVQKRGQVAGYFVERANNSVKFDVCKHCKIDAFKKLDDRAVEMPKYGVPREPSEAVLHAGVSTMAKYAAIGNDTKSALSHAWRTMFDEAVRALPRGASAERNAARFIVDPQTGDVLKSNFAGVSAIVPREIPHTLAAELDHEWRHQVIEHGPALILKIWTKK